MSENEIEFPVPFRNAPFNTYHIVDAEDFKTTNLASYIRHQKHDIERTVYFASRERRANQALTCKLDPPYRLWLTEKESRQKDYIKFKFEKRGLQRPTSHLVTKKEIQAHHKHREIDDYHLSRQVEICEATLHPGHNLHNLFPHADVYHPEHDTKAQQLSVSTGNHAPSNSNTGVLSKSASSSTGGKSPSQRLYSSAHSPDVKPKGKLPKWSPSKAAIAAVEAAAAQRKAPSSTSRLPPVSSPGDKAHIDGKKTLW